MKDENKESLITIGYCILVIVIFTITILWLMKC